MKKHKSVCVILSTMLIVGGCGKDSNEKTYTEENQVLHYNNSGNRDNTNSGGGFNPLMWYLIGQSHGSNGFAPLAAQGRYSAPSMSRFASGATVGKTSIPSGSFKGSSISGRFSAGG